MIMDTTAVRPEVMAEAKDVLKALVLEQDGKAVAGGPAKGAYAIGVHPRMTFWGDRAYVAKLLAKAFPGCEFTWKD